MGQVKSFQAFSQFPNYSASLFEEESSAPRKSAPKEAPKQGNEIETPCCILLKGAAGAPPNSVGAALLSHRVEDVPRRYSFSALAIELPPPASLGAYDNYEAVLFQPGLVSYVVALTLTPNHTWAGTLTGISLAFSPTMRIIVRPANSETGQSGEPLLVGTVAACSSR